ncbi:MAG: hypothetical protein GXO28_06260 [Methanopyri archaeon]|nr:hypothetical protein [Methanopyri archaeon]
MGDVVESMSAMFARALNQATVFCFAEIMGRGWRAVRNRMYEYVAEVMVDLFEDKLRDADPVEIAEAALKLYYPKTELIERNENKAVFKVKSNCPIVRMSVYMLEKHPEVRRYVCDPDDLVIEGERAEGEEVERLYDEIDGLPSCRIFDAIMERLDEPWRMRVEEVDLSGDVPEAFFVVEKR